MTKSYQTLFLLLILAGASNPLSADPNNSAQDRSGSATTYQEVAGLIWTYFEALGNPAANESLATILAPVWHRKEAWPTPENKLGLKMLNREEMIAQLALSRHSFMKEGKPSLTAIQIYYPDFAIARLDFRELATVHLFTLFKHKGNWLIASETVVDQATAVRNAHFESDTPTDDALKVLEDYYHAVEFGRPDDLKTIFAGPHWHMKNPENGELVEEGTEAFAKRLEDGPSPGYYDDRQVTDVQLLFGNVVVARVDNPTTRSTTMFTMMKLSESWRIIDKSWSYPN